MLILGLHQLGLNVLAMLRRVILLLLHGCKNLLVIVDDTLHLLVMLFFHFLNCGVLFPLEILMIELELPDLVLLLLQLGLHLFLFLLNLLQLSEHFLLAYLRLLQLLLLLLYDFHVLCVEVPQILAVL